MGKFTSKGINMPVILAGAGVITLIILFIILLPDKKNDTEEIRTLEGRLARLEKQLTETEDRMDQRMSSLESLGSQTGMISEQADRLQAIPLELENIQSRLEHLDKRQGNLEKKMAGSAPAPVKQSAAAAPVRKTTKTARTAKKPDKADAPARPLQYHHVVEGDTLYSIANRYNISVAQLLRMNRLPKDATIHPEQKLLVAH